MAVDCCSAINTSFLSLTLKAFQAVNLCSVVFCWPCSKRDHVTQTNIPTGEGPCYRRAHWRGDFLPVLLHWRDVQRSWFYWVTKDGEKRAALLITVWNNVRLSSNRGCLFSGYENKKTVFPLVLPLYLWLELFSQQ